MTKKAKKPSKESQKMAASMMQSIMGGSMIGRAMEMAIKHKLDIEIRFIPREDDDDGQ